MVDFSEAERVGFILAFVEFWSLRPGNERTTEQLNEAATSLLKGCLQHFRSGIARVKRISGVIPPDRADAFEARVLALLTAPDSNEFRARGAVVIRDFPQSKTWLQWWMRESHASMLFTSERKMEPEIWESIPDSTNAEEAMHWKMYCAAGRDHDLMDGLLALNAVAAHFRCLYTGTISNFFYKITST